MIFNFIIVRGSQFREYIFYLNIQNAMRKLVLFYDSVFFNFLILNTYLFYSISYKSNTFVILLVLARRRGGINFRRDLFD